MKHPAVGAGGGELMPVTSDITGTVDEGVRAEDGDPHVGPLAAAGSSSSSIGQVAGEGAGGASGGSDHSRSTQDKTSRDVEVGKDATASSSSGAAVRTVKGQELPSSRASKATTVDAAGGGCGVDSEAPGGSSSMRWRAGGGSGDDKRSRESDQGVLGGPRGGMVAPPAPGPSSRRHSKWGNSAIKGRLARPSDGRATMLEQEAKERQEKIEKLRRLEETRRETRRQRDEAKRKERVDAGKLDSHSFVWETLGDSSASSSEEDAEGEEGKEDIYSGEDNGVAAKEQGSENAAARGVDAPDERSQRAVRIDAGGVSERRDARRDERRSERQLGEPQQQKQQQEGEGGWACDVCTFLNDVAPPQGNVGSSSDNGWRLRCEMCDAEGPKNAGSPWLTA
ncbi:unnamed protein product [Sphacelaria rigidula]